MERASLPEQNQIRTLSENAVELLKQLIAIPSFSGEEDGTAGLISDYLQSRGIPVKRIGNNIIARNLHFCKELPTVLLNSHHDTVKPNAGYTRDPFLPETENGRLYGLGSNDAGGALVSLLAAFIHFYDKPIPCNLVFAASAEEENSGSNGIVSILEELGNIDLAIVGEPTQMNLAVAEKGLIVIDCASSGTSSHAAHPNSDNAIYNAIQDIEWFRNFRFPNVSDTLGEVKMTVTMIQAGTQHNVVPGECRFTVDIRTNDCYSNQEVTDIIQQNIRSQILPRSLRLNSSRIDPAHPFVQAALVCGCKAIGSPTISDQALMPFTSVKIGPGDTLRSHTADEFIFIDEIDQGIEKYIDILNKYFQNEQ